MYSDECDLGDGELPFPLYATDTEHRARRYQRGHLFRKSGRWYLRYSDNGKQSTKALTRGTKTEARRLADEFLKPFNDGSASQSAMTLDEFVETVYLPSAKVQHRASTLYGYQNLWKQYLKAKGKIGVREFRTADGERILNAIASGRDLSVTTLSHVKAFLSGVFRYARRLGVLNGENPMRDVAIPKAKPPRETYAYSLDEIQKMLDVLLEPAATIAAVAAFTGMRRGEIAGLSWEDYDGREIRVSRSVWRGIVSDPKTSKSKAPVPVVPQLAARLNAYRDSCGNPVKGLMFHGLALQRSCAVQTPLNLDVLAVTAISPKLNQAGLKWHGWHAFRRGLATNLYQLGVPSKVIQRILRHANVSVTEKCYIKTSDGDGAAAMEKLSAAIG